MLWCLPLAVPLIAKNHNRFTSPRIQWPYDAMPCRLKFSRLVACVDDIVQYCHRPSLSHADLSLKCPLSTFANGVSQGHMSVGPRPLGKLDGG